jgi:hypothetical protein
MSRSRRNIIIGAGVIAALLLFAFLCWMLRPNPQLTKVKEMRRELFTPASRKLSPQERREKFEVLRQEQAKLTPAERKQLADEARKRRKAEIAHYFTLSKKEKTAVLDQQINRMEAMRKQMQSANSNGRANSGGSANGFGFPQVSNGPPGAANQSPEERERRRKEMLDSTTPEERAQFDQYRKDLQARMAQRGISPTPGGMGRRP